MVEVFKTNILGEKTALNVIAALQEEFPGHSITIDLEDCDKVLRIASDQDKITAEKVVQLAAQLEITIDAL